MTGGADTSAAVAADGSKRQVAPTEKVLFLFFCWCWLLLLSAFLVVDSVPAEQVAYLVLAAAGLFVVCTNWFLRRPLDYLPLTYGAFFVLVFVQALILSPLHAGAVLPLALIQVLAVLLPAFLHLWRAQIVLGAGLTVAVAAAVVWCGVSAAQAVRAAVLIAVSVPLGLFALHLANSSSAANAGEARIAKLETEGFRLIVQAESAGLADRAWGVALLQATLFAVLVFLDFAFAGPDFLVSVYFKLYSLVLIILASLLYSVIRPSHLAAAVAWTTVLVGCVLSLVEIGRGDSALIRSAVPLVFLALTTTALPWSVGKQVLVASGLLAAALVTRLLPSAPDLSTAFLEIGTAFGRYRFDILVVLLGVGASVVFARALGQRNLKTYVRHFEKTGPPQVVDCAPPEKLTLPCAEVLGIARTEKLLSGLFILGVVSCCASTVLLLKLDSRWLLGATSVWLLFFSVWGMLIYAYRRDSAFRPLWSFAAFITVVLICWPSILIVYGEHGAFYWLFWPACLLTGIGLIPWGLRELGPIYAVVIVTGIKLHGKIHLDDLTTIVLVVASILSLLISLRGSRLLQEECLVRGFKECLTSAASARDVLRFLADYLSGCCRSSTAVLKAEDDSIEVVTAGQVFPMGCDPEYLRTLETAVKPYEPTGLRMRLLNWLGPESALIDSRFGVFAPQHGLLIELDPQCGRSPRHADILVERNFPALPFKNNSEARIVGVLGAIAVLKLEIFREQQLRAESERRSELAQTEREYELGVLVHDINNTVQDLTVLCESIVDDISAAPGCESTFTGRIDRIAAIARSMAAVVSDAKRKRELERIVELNPREAVDVFNVVQEIVTFSTVRAERKRIGVRLKLGESSEPLWVKISAREHLETILRNLLNNAITYSDPGVDVGVKLDADVDSITVTVSDNGPGLTAEECESIFLSGYRGRAGARVSGGLGLGLSQSRRVAEAAGGSLTASSPGLGQGATFVLRLPRFTPPKEKIYAGAWALMVDDQAPLTDFYTKIARALKLEPGVASSITEARELLEERGRPVFVLTDIHLGAANGLDLVSEVRRIYGNALPVLVVSGMNDVDIVSKALAAGASDYVAKPIGRQALFSRIQSLLASN